MLLLLDFDARDLYRAWMESKGIFPKILEVCVLSFVNTRGVLNFSLKRYELTVF